MAAQTFFISRENLRIASLKFFEMIKARFYAMHCINFRDLDAYNRIALFYVKDVVAR